MAAQQGFRAINNEPFVYQENSAGDSASLGIDSTGVYSVSVSATPGTSPSASSQIVITPGGDITLNPTIKVFVNSPLETASSITIDAGKLNLPTTTSTNGQMTIGASTVFHTFGTRNLFMGESSGTFTLTPGLAVANTAAGANTLSSLTTGQANLALGDFSLNLLEGGSFNSALGQDVLESLVSGSFNTVAGEGSGSAYTTVESSNILLNNPGVILDSNKLRIGAGTGSGDRQINQAFISGVYSTAVGATAGVALVADNDQIGSISGIAGTVLVGGTKPSFATLSGVAVTSITGTANQIIPVGPSTGSVTLSLSPTLIAPGSIASTTSLTAGNLTTAGIVYNAVTTGLLSSHQATNHNVQVGNASGQLADVAPSATSGVPLISQGAAADPVFGTAVVAGGGTGNTTFTAFSVIAAGTTATGAFQNVSGTGSANQVLVAQPGALPIWAAVPATAGVTAIAGTTNQWSVSASTGSVTGSIPSTFIAPGTIASTTTNAAGTNFILPVTSSTVGQILQNSIRILHTFGTDNFFAGRASGNFTLSGARNTSVGVVSSPALSSGTDNTAVGYGACNQISSASFCTGIGTSALESCTTSGNVGIGYQTGYTLPGVNNVAIGYQALKQATSSTATYNVAIGYQAGFNYTTSAPSHNILLNNAGTAGESNKLRIGAATGSGTQQLNAAFICGVYNTAVGATAGVVLADSTDQLGGLAGAAGTVLVGGTKPAFTALNTLSVTAIAGTTNQWSVSASTGSVTGSIPSTFIAPGTIASTTTNAAGTNFILPVTSTTAGQILQNSVRVFHTFGTDNTFVGSGAGNTSLTTSERNVAIGVGAGASLSGTPGHNVYVGYQAGNADDGTGGTNVAVGFQALLAFSGGTTPRNVAIGPSSLIALAGAGVHNTCLGYNTGSAYTTTESDNILIGYNTAGTVGESNTMRLAVGTGTGNGQVNKTFVAGIRGITTVNADAVAVLVDSAGQLGTVSSSIRYKENVMDMADESSPLYELRPVVFNYKTQPGKKSVGLIAEEVLPVMPDLVVYNQDGDVESVKYHDLSILLLNEIQKLAARVSELEGVINGNR